MVSNFEVNQSKNEEERRAIVNNHKMSNLKLKKEKREHLLSQLKKISVFKKNDYEFF